MPHPQIAESDPLCCAVDRILASPDEILKLVRSFQRSGNENVKQVVPRIIDHYSRRAAMGGGATALPAMLPGIGTLAYLATGPLADMLLLLKWESEMCLAISAAYGYDIRDPNERRLALLLAAVKTVEVQSGRSAAWDLADASGEAIWNYTPRRVAKHLSTVLAVMLALDFSRVAFRVVPVVGFVVGAWMNKVLTTRVGRRAQQELVARRQEGL